MSAGGKIKAQRMAAVSHDAGSQSAGAITTIIFPRLNRASSVDHVVDAAFRISVINRLSADDIGIRHTAGADAPCL